MNAQELIDSIKPSEWGADKFEKAFYPEKEELAMPVPLGFKFAYSKEKITGAEEIMEEMR